MTTAIPTQANYTQPFLDGAKDVNQPARYELIGELTKDCESVLDVGCGDGLLRQFVTCEYVGIDADESAIMKARESHPGSDFYHRTAEQWDDGLRFGAVVLNEMLYYLDQPADMLNRFAQIVSPRGKLIVSIANIWIGRPPWQALFNKNRRVLSMAKRFANQREHKEHTVEQNGKKWTVLVIHP